ncbi:helix-turn-helix domain-containing protein [Sneathiella chinensis]|uniref:AraC family transcriptional regulator n=1 Tax=Sneathiella chinensis TaxID=349750 RepID=A0ABQ5U2N0_9PROT|nr:AraC family transcriptional regulator [Sneathiella chinensis]GLQ06083.1 AraC family transcriptional regulator [Sneathiella chinensis]
MNVLSSIPSFVFGETLYRGGGRFGPITNPHLELLVVHSGGVVFAVDGEDHVLTEGYAALVPVRSHLVYDYRDGMDTRVSWCEAILPEAREEIFQFLATVPFTLPVSHRMLDLHRMGAGLELGGGPEEMALAYSLGRTLFHEYIYQAQVVQREKPVHKLVLRAKHFIEQSVDRPCSLSDIAAFANATPQYLTRIFKRDMGQTPVAYLWTVRSQKAVRMLRNSGLSVAEIAYSCGYENANHFSRHIREKFGVPPTEIRRRKWGPE